MAIEDGAKVVEVAAVWIPVHVGDGKVFEPGRPFHEFSESPGSFVTGIDGQGSDGTCAF